MRTFLIELRHVLSALLKSPLFSGIAIVTIALGIGANTAVFSFVNSLLLRALPLPDADRIVVLGEINAQQTPTRAIVSPRNLEDWKRQTQTLEDLGQWRDWRFRFPTTDGTELIPSGIASAGLFKA